MVQCFSYQELEKNRRKIAGASPLALFAAMRRGGVEICGLGVANTPLLSLLPPLGISILSVRDKKPPPPAVLSLLRQAGIRLVTGEGYLEGLSAPVIFRTPSLSPRTPALSAARARGAAVLTEVALLIALTPASLFSVTGSDGKTTTAQMTAALLRASGKRVFLGGNIGTPLLSSLPDMQKGDALVLELSSFQLSDMDAPHGRALITNITENHLDWHTDMQDYIAAKARILGGGTAILPADCPLLVRYADESTLFFGGECPQEGGSGTLFYRDGIATLSSGGTEAPLFSVDVLSCGGRHNRQNALAATALALPYLSEDAPARAFSDFRLPPHRCEALGRFGGVLCYNSSIDTTPARTAVTLSSFQTPPTVLLGGRGKSLSYRPLAEALLAYARQAVLTGEDAAAMADALREYDPEGRFSYFIEPDFEAAVRLAHQKAGENGILLLSPAATSHDAFPDYRARGDAFAAILKCL